MVLSLDVEEFLKEAAASLEMTFNGTCAFSEIQNVVIEKTSRMTESFTTLRSNASLLCDREKRPMKNTSIKGKLIFVSPFSIFPRLPTQIKFTEAETYLVIGLSIYLP